MTEHGETMLKQDFARLHIIRNRFLLVTSYQDSQDIIARGNQAVRQDMHMFTGLLVFGTYF
jgi:hypothetical protein